MTATDTDPGDYYATLGVAPGAANAAIRTAYRNLMRRYHPDVNASVDAELRAKAINEAFACLRDDQLRASYDRWRDELASDQGPADVRPQRHAAYRAHPTDWARPPESQRAASLMLQRSWWNLALLGAAIVATIITFSLTSETPPPGPGEIVVPRS